MRPNSERARLAILFIWLVMGMSVVSAAALFLQYRLLHNVKYGQPYTMESLNTSDMLQTIIGVMSIGVFIISVVMFIRWFRRAYFNLHQNIENLSFSEGWAAGAWFVPIMNLYRPYRIMKELNLATDSILEDHKEVSFTPTNVGLIRTWWVLWILVSLFGNISSRIYFRADTLEELMSASVIGIIQELVSIPLALIAIKVVKDYVVKEELLQQVSAAEDVEHATHLVK